MTMPAVQSSRTLLAYGVMAMPLCLAVIPIVNYLPAFYAQELHLNVGLVGAVFLAARLWDGVADLLVGWLSDRSMSRFGRRKPWVLIGAPCLMVSTWFLCNPPEGAGLMYLVVWAALFYTAWTAMYIPYLSWGAELATDYVERSRVTSYREAFTMIGNLFFATAPLVLLTANAPLNQVLVLISVAVLFMVPIASVPLFSVRDPIPTRRPETHLMHAIVSLTKDRVLIRFIIAVLCIWTGEGVINSLVVFSFKVGLQMPDKLFWVIFIIYVATLCTLPLAMRVGKSTEKHHLLAGAIAIKAIGFAAHIWVPMGYFPIVAALWIIVGIVHTFTVILPASILADIIDHGEVNVGERRSGAYVAIYNLAMKVGLALGVGISFGLLALVNYDPGAAQFSAADVTNIRWLGFGLPALMEAGAIVMLMRHPITRRVHQELRERIDAQQALGTAN